MGRLMILVLAAFALSACNLVLAPTPDPPTPTPLELEEQRYLDAFLQNTEPDGVWQTRLGLRVIQPVFREEGDNSWSECPESFPIAALEYGLFYLPGDDLYPNRNPGAVFLYLCFASEQDAMLAGYQRGPH